MTKLNVKQWDIWDHKLTYTDENGKEFTTTDIKEVSNTDYKTVRNFTHMGELHTLTSELKYENGTVCVMTINNK